MADSKVSLYCYGHSQINGSWVPENFHFCHECDKSNQIKLIVRILLLDKFLFKLKERMGGTGNQINLWLMRTVHCRKVFPEKDFCYVLNIVTNIL